MGAEVAVKSEGRVSLESLYAEHIEGATRLAFLLTGDADTAQDIAQEAFVRIAGRFHDLRHPAAFPSYLRTSVVNLTRSHFRRLRTQRAYLEREAKRSPGVADGPDIEGRDEMWRALQKIPYRRRAAIVLRYYEDLTEQQTADALGCSSSAVKALVGRGLEMLRAEMRGVER
jgi:RNA polymerase sigma-70 factor (sigma-E family)